MRLQIFTIVFFAACITTQAQMHLIQEAEYEKDREKEIFPRINRSSFSSEKLSQDNPQLPLEGLYYFGEQYNAPWDRPAGSITYKYHENL